MDHRLLSCRTYLIALVLILLAMTLAGCKHRVVSVEEIDKLIKEQVPIGSDQQQVRAFIDNLKIDSLKIDCFDLHKASPEALMGHDDQKKIAELGDSIAMYTGAFIRHSQTDIISSDNITIIFYLDKEGKLIGYTVHELGSD